MMADTRRGAEQTDQRIGSQYCPLQGGIRHSHQPSSGHQGRSHRSGVKGEETCYNH